MVRQTASGIAVTLGLGPAPTARRCGGRVIRGAGASSGSTTGGAGGTLSSRCTSLVAAAAHGSAGATTRQRVSTRVRTCQLPFPSAPSLTVRTYDQAPGTRR